MFRRSKIINQSEVALFTRAWIEIEKRIDSVLKVSSRPLYEGVD